jgi:predicted transcriptional regulator
MKIYTIFLIFLFFLSGIYYSYADQSSIIVVYGNENDRSIIQNILDHIEINYVLIEVSELSSTHFLELDVLIFTSSIEFSLEDEVEDALEVFIQDGTKNLIIISPYIEKFNDIEEYLGILDVEEFIESNIVEPLEWIISLTDDYSNYTTDDLFMYQGTTSHVILDNNTETLAEFINVSGENAEELELPIPAIWRISEIASILVIITALESSNNQNLGINQSTLPILSLIYELLFETIHKILQNQSETNGDPDSEDSELITDEDTTNENQLTNLVQFISNINLSEILIILFLFFIVLLGLFFSKLIAFIDWLIRKSYVLGIFVISSFYKIQKRTLSYNEVVINSYRSDILDYLEHLGKYGAHLRELKSLTKMGSGSLLWHLQVLEDYGFIKKYSIKGYTIFLSYKYEFDPYLKEIEINLKSKYILEILEVLINNITQKLSLEEIQEITTIEKRALRRLLLKLADYDLIKIMQYPELYVEISDKEKITKLHESLSLRESWS